MNELQFSSSFTFLRSCDDMVEILQKMDPNSEVAQKMTLKQTKVSWIISHGLFPHYQKKTIEKIKAAPGYTLGTDAGTFKLHGLS